jgi:TonB-linked SusC/RagA family outer membrane protein
MKNNDHYAYGKAIIFFLLLFTFLFLEGGYANVSIAQQHHITGQVTNKQSGKTLVGVNIRVKGTTRGTFTDKKGKYSLDVKNQNAKLIFSFIGFETQTISIKGRTTINVALKPATLQGKQLVVVGYGTQKKQDLTGAISTVSSKSIEQNGITGGTVEQELQGQVPGVQVHHNSHAPGGGIQVKIRGVSTLTAGGEPLYVIDGMPIATDFRTNNADIGNKNTSNYGPPPNPLNSISTSDIASIQVLKGPSATAIYGSRGSNGVVLITTKRGTPGQQHINIMSSYGWQKVDHTLDLINARQYANLANEAAAETDKSPVFTKEQVASFGTGTNWQDVIFRVAPEKQEQVSFSGGSKNLRYYVSGNYGDQGGVIKGSRFVRYGANVNLDGNISSRFTVQNHLMYTSTTNKQAMTGTRGNADDPNIIKQVLTAPPTIPVRNDQGELTNFSNTRTGSGPNPLFMAEKYQELGNADRVIENASGEYNITKGLSIKSRLGADVRNWRYHQYIPINDPKYPNGKATVISERTVNVENSDVLHFKRTLHKNDIKALAGFSFQQEKDELLEGVSENFPTNFFKTNNLAAGGNIQPSQSKATKWRLISYFGRVNYQYNNKYLITGTVRVDGSSKFGPKNKFGTFPSVAVAWKLGNEKFIKNLNVFNQLKLRAAYGITGNQDIGEYNSKSNIEFQFDEGHGYFFNGKLFPMAKPDNLGNLFITWEKSKETDIGLDMGVFGNRLTVNLDVYNQKTSDLLFQKPIPHQSGFSTFLQNVGSVRNKGLEVGITSHNIESKSFTWETNLNISFNRNKILSLGRAAGGGAPLKDFDIGALSGGHVKPYNTAIHLEVGKPVGTFYGYKRIGTLHSQKEISQVATQAGAQPGDPMFKDINGDGKIDSKDLTIIGNPNPNYTFGITNNFSFRHWNVHVFLNGAVGNDVVNTTLDFLERGTGLAESRYIHMWTPQNSNKNGLGATTSKTDILNSGVVENGSFLRASTLSLSYTFPVQQWQKELQRLKLTFAVHNAFTITSYSGYDPEVDALGGGRNENIIKGIGRFEYPVARTFQLTLNIGF